MPDLTDFGVDTRPRVAKRTTLTLGKRQVGHIAYDVAHDCACYVSERETEDHRYHGEDPWYDFPFDGPAYGLSLELFPRLYDADIGRVYIVEVDEGRVLQFAYSQFVDGHPINFEDEADGRGYEKDPQKVVPIDAAVDLWPDHYPGIYTKQAQFR